MTMARQKPQHSGYRTTTLSLSAHLTLTPEQLDYYTDKQKTLPKMKKNQVSIFGLDLQKIHEQQLLVTSFICSTVDKPIRLKKNPVVLIRDTGQLLARVVVDFTQLGVLPPNTSRPWTFIFPKESLLQDPIKRCPDWSLAFELPPHHQLDLSNVGGNRLSDSTQATLDKLVQDTLLKQNKLSFTALLAKRSKPGGLVTTLLIHNRTNRDVNIKQIPFNFYDAMGDLSAKGIFKLAQLTIKANTSKPVTFVYPQSGIVKENMDLSNFTIRHAASLED